MGLQGLAKQCVDRESLPRTSLRSRRVFIDGDSYVWRRSRRVIDSRGLNDFPEYMSIVKAEATAWRAEGLAVVMYFDGNSGEKKFVTSCKRVARQLRATSSTEEIPYLAKDTVNKQTVPIMLYKRLTRMALRREGIAVKQCWGEADQELCVDATAQQAVVAGDDSDLLVLADEYVFVFLFFVESDQLIAWESFSAITVPSMGTVIVGNMKEHQLRFHQNPTPNTTSQISVSGRFPTKAHPLHVVHLA